MPAGAVVAVAGETRAGTHSVGAVRGRRDMGSFLGVARAALPAAVGSRRRSESPLARVGARYLYALGPETGSPDGCPGARHGWDARLADDGRTTNAKAPAS